MIEKGWDSINLIHNHHLTTGQSSTTSLGFLASLLFCIPAFISCTHNEGIYDEYTEVTTDIHLVSKSVHTGIDGTKAGASLGIKQLDVFVFNDDELARLDSYERVSNYDGNMVKASSKSGKKILVVIANSDIRSSRLVEINTYYDILEYKSLFRLDDPEYPVMSGSCRIKAGEECEIRLMPIMSKVVVSELDAPELQDVRVYLTHMNASARVMQFDEFKPTEILDKGDSKNYEPGVELYCYPNNVNEESIGSPFTRLVVEGEKNGETIYYPILLNEERGMERDVEYRVNLKINGKGSSNPEDLVDPGTVIEKGSLAVFPSNFLTGKDGETLHIWAETFPDDAEVLFDIEDLEFDRERGIYDYKIDESGKHLYLTLRKGGTGMFMVHAGPPVNDGAIVLVICNP